jgi:hypothetical protein
MRAQGHHLEDITLMMVYVRFECVGEDVARELGVLVGHRPAPCRSMQLTGQL